MLFIALTMMGYFSYKHLPVELFPNAVYPKLYVQVGASLEVDPSYMEREAIIPLEGAIGTLEGVESISSEAGSRSGFIEISFNQNVDIKFAYLKLLEKVNVAKSTVPEEFMVTVFKLDLEQLSNMLMSLEVRGGGGADRVRHIVDREITPKLESISGIAKVDVSGGQEKSLEIIVNKDEIEAHGISVSDIQSTIRQNATARTFVGKVHENNKRYFVNVSADYTSIPEIENLIVRKEGNIRIKDIAKVYFGVKEQSTISRVNGKEAVSIQLTRDSQENMIDLSHRTIAQIEELNTLLAEKDIEIVVQENNAEIMEKNIDLIIDLALTGGILAIFLLWVFLKNIRLVLVVAASIPISIYTAFNFFYAAGISINALTLIGMALAIGMLIDNSVVVLENIYRLASQKMGADKAVLQGTKEVRRSIIAATFTTVTVFLPFLFAKDFFVQIMGKHIGVSIISTLLVSLVVALLLVPMLTHFFLKKETGNKKVVFQSFPHHHRLMQVYLLLLKTGMRNPAKTIVGALLIFFIAILINMAVSISGNQEAELKTLTLYVSMPEGSTLDKTDALVSTVEEKLENLEEKEDVYSRIYEDEATITVKLIEDFKELNNKDLAGIKREIDKQIEEIRAADISFDPPQSSQRFRGSGGGDDFMGFLGIGSNTEKIIIKGQDFDKMRNMANDLEYYVEDLASIDNVQINISDERPEAHIVFDKHIMSRFGVNMGSVLTELNSFQGETNSGSKFKQGTDEYDIIIKTDEKIEERERDLRDLRALEVRGTSGASYELDNISQIYLSTGNAVINRQNQEKQIELRYQFTEDVQDSKELLDNSRIEIDELVATVRVPSGIALEVVHEENQLSEYKFLILAAFILIYMILASVFESLATPVVLMFSIPLAAIGSLIALILTGNSILNPNTLTGFLILLGVVVNNGIILIDYSNILRKQGYRSSRALMMASLARVRPILITAITTIIALFPMAMGKAEYVGSIGEPFAVTVIGGLALSTLLTLVFIPTFTSGLENAIAWINNQKWWIRLTQLIVFATVILLIYLKVHVFIWQLILTILSIIGIPAISYFVLTSLKQAREDIIPANEPIRIRIQNLVKIYDWDNKFVREWKAGINIRKRLGLEKEYEKLTDFEGMLWQIPLAGFLFFFIFIHLESRLWMFFLPLLFFLMIYGMWKPVSKFVEHKNKQGKKWIFRLNNILYQLFFWGFPLYTMYFWKTKGIAIGVIVIGAVFWYLGHIIFVSSNYIYRTNLNIDRIKGRFGGIRRMYFRSVVSIPLIGKRKKPFKALKGVSLEIGNGMFGLLGPNGAGKSTMMRIICGILEQSYGKVWINGFDTDIHREELQGLIGYLPQEFGMYENMTAWDFLKYMSILKKVGSEDDIDKRVKYVLEAVHMYHNRHEKIGSFSGGMKQRIGIAQILLHLPRILVVDEPTAGLDPRERIRFRNLLVELSRERIVIFSTHIIEDISSSCNTVAVMKKGEMKYFGTPSEMANIANNKVWQFTVDASEFEEYEKKYTVVHHMRNENDIRVRCLAEEAPTEHAKIVRPILEDAYLYLLTKKN